MIKIDHTYDSHVHFFGVGLPAVDWITKDLTSPPPHLLNSKKLIRGFGLSPDEVSDDKIEQLFQSHPDHFFCLSYNDGHSSLVSKNLAHEVGFHPKTDYKETEHSFSLFENERDLFLKKLPPRTQKEFQEMAYYALEYFLTHGISSIRTMTTNKTQWLALKEIYKQRSEVEFSVDCYFSEFMAQSFDEARSAFESASKTIFSPLVKPKGLKIFIDGSIGQNTAAMSSNKNSIYRLTDEEINSRMFEAFVNLKCDLAVHTIGDLALEKMLTLYSQFSKTHPIQNTLHFEHAPIFSLKCLDLLKNENLNCAFHFQPSHWIKDKTWYDKNHLDLEPHEIYPFQFLEENSYSFDFGSDAPIEESFKELTLKGLNEIEKTKASNKI